MWMAAMAKRRMAEPSATPAPSEVKHIAPQPIYPQTHAAVRRGQLRTGGRSMLLKTNSSLLITLLSGIAATAIATAPMATAKQAPDTIGTKFSDAKKTLSDSGYKVVVISKVGARIATNDCIVSHQQVQPVPIKDKSTKLPNNMVRISLNCYPPKQASKSK
jgi:hypothetical protein